MPRQYRHLRTLADLAERCTEIAATGCWEWNGCREGDNAPKVWIQGEIGSTSLQVALPVLALGRRANPGVLYIPTCCKVDCMRWEHRREGTVGELRQIVALARFGRTPAEIAEAIADKAQADADKAERRAARVKAAAKRAADAQARRDARAEQQAKTAEQRRERDRLKKAAQRANGAKLHDKFDRMGRPGVMPQSFAAGLRKPGSNARPVPSLVKPEATEARITERTRVTVAPACTDQRYTVHALPPGYRSTLDPRECRPWAQAAAQGRQAA